MKTQREHWGSYFGLIMAAAGSAIGLGTLWKFPYVTGENGGGLFVIIYIVCTLFIGIPLFMGELIIGRKAQRAAVGSFAELSSPGSNWRAVGWLGVLSSFLILSYYSVVSGWGLNYVFLSLVQFYQNRTPAEIASVFDQLYVSGDISLFWHLIFMLVTIGVVYQGVRKGIEYWSRILTVALLVLLIGLFAYSTSLDGFSQGLRFIFYPDFAKFSPSSALEALGLAFFTMSLGQGIIITYGSYMKHSDDIPRTAFIIGSMVIVISLLAAMTIFPMIFSFGFQPQEGFGLVFKTLPVLFAQMPGSLLVSSTFFILLVFTALTSAVALLEVVAANFIDLFDWSRSKAVWISGAAAFLLGIPSALSGSQGIFSAWQELYGKNFFLTIDALVSTWLLPLCGLFTALFVGWRMDSVKRIEEYLSGTRLSSLYSIWLFFIRWIAPAAILLIILQKSGIIDIDKF